MDTTTSKLILACYALLALLVVTIGVIFFRAPPQSYAPSAGLATRRDSIAVKPAATSTALFKQLRRDIEKQRRRTADLQRLLATREQVLNQQTAQLETQTEESRRLQSEADRYLQLLMDLVQESADSMDDNLNALRDADEGNAASETPPTLESLEALLETAEWELEQSRETAAATEMEVMEQALKMESMRQAILNAGNLAVPVLVNMLSEQDSELRSWAATSLGTIGSDSPFVMNALQLATEDDDASLRSAAQAAIERLRDR